MNSKKTNAPNLAEIQSQWFDWLEQDKSHLSSHLASFHTTQPKLTDVRLNIYRNNRFQVLLGTLQQHFPMILALVGANYFKQLARLYCRQQPPSQRNLHEYGLHQVWLATAHQQHSFAEFLEDNKGIQDAGLDYLIPLAQLESALQSAYFTADDVAWDGDDFAQLSPNTQMCCQVMLSHSFTLLPSQWDLTAIANSLKSVKTNGESSEPLLQLTRDAFYFAVYRRANKPQFCALTVDEYNALNELKTQTPKLADWLDQHACAGPSLANWINSGWITHFTIPADQQNPKQIRKPPPSHPNHVG